MANVKKAKQASSSVIASRVLAIQAVERGLESAILEVQAAIAIEDFGPCHMQLIDIRDRLIDTKIKVSAILGIMHDVKNEIDKAGK